MTDDGVFVLMEGVNDASYRRLVYRTGDLVGLKHDHALFPQEGKKPGVRG